MHFVVTGGNGFIGRAFVRRLLDDGHTATIVGRSAPETLADGTHFVAGGVEALAERPDLLEAADAVCHLAWASIPASSNRDPMGEIDRNIRPTVALLEAMRNAGNRRLLFLSSGGAVYGRPRTTPMAEDHPKDPISPYGVGKLSAEKFITCYGELFGISPVIIRPANPYGPNQGKVGQLGAVWSFYEAIRKGEHATVFGDGSTVRDFVHVRDLADLMLATLQQDATGVFNCGGGAGVSLAELISELEEATGRTLAIDRQPARPFDPPAIVLDISRARDELGWTPRISLAEGIRELAATL